MLRLLLRLKRRNIVSISLNITLILILLQVCYHIYDFYSNINLDNHQIYQTKPAFLIVNDEIRYDILLSHSLYYNLNEEDKKDLIIWKSLSKILMKKIKYKPSKRYKLTDSLEIHYLGNISWDYNYNIHKDYSNCPNDEEGGYYHNLAKTSPSIVIFENCVPGFELITMERIYQYYDKLLNYIKFLRVKYSKSIIMWSKPSLPSHICKNLQILHQYLILKHLIHDNGVLVIQPDLIQQSKVITSSNSLHEAIQYQLQYLNIHTQPNGLSDLLSKLNMVSSNIKLQEICFPLINTRKYDKRCFPYPDQLYPLLVTGLGGSGTHDLTNKLRYRGVRVRHEEIDLDGTVSWFHAVSDNYGGKSYPHHAALKKSNYFSPRFSNVIHITRCPIKQISSFTSHLQASYQFVFDHMIIMKNTWANYMIHEEEKMKKFTLQSDCKRGEKCNLHFSALAWLFWNDHIHNYADVTFHIENIDELINHICTKILSSCNNNDHNNYNNNNNNDNNNNLVFKLKSMLGIKNNRDNVKSSKFHKQHNEYNIQEVAHIAGTDIAANIYNKAINVYGYDKNC